MYAYIKGKVKSINADAVIIENNDIGYLLLCPTPYLFKLDTETILYTYLHVKEDVFALYGFKDLESLNLFKRLLSVSGIGPKSALSILACDNPNEVYLAIEMADTKFLAKFPGIGQKAASQIVLDLKGKLALEDTTTNTIERDILEALGVLGYKKSDIQKALKHIDTNQALEIALKDALAYMIKGK